MDVRLANEIIDASNKTGGAIKKREDTHKMVKQTVHSHTSDDSVYLIVNYLYGRDYELKDYRNIGIIPHWCRKNNNNRKNFIPYRKNS